MSLLWLGSIFQQCCRVRFRHHAGCTLVGKPQRIGRGERGEGRGVDKICTVYFYLSFLVYLVLYGGTFCGGSMNEGGGGRRSLKVMNAFGKRYSRSSVDRGSGGQREWFDALGRLM